MRYHPDGTLLGADIVVSSTLVDAACRWREYAIAVSTSWVDYVSARPDLKSPLRGVALTAF